MKILTYLLLIAILIACGKSETEYLYSEYDDEYNTIVTLANAECMEGAEIFKVLDKEQSFERFKVGQIFRSNEEFKEDGKEVSSLAVRRFFRIKYVDENRMEVELKSSKSNENSLIEITQEDANTILDTVSNGICNKPKSLYHHSNLSSSSALRFRKERKNEEKIDGKSVYKKVNEEFIIRKNVPVFLLAFDGTIKFESTETGKSISNQYVRELSEISAKDCKDDSVCEEELMNGNPCQVETDVQAYNRSEVDAPLLTFPGCNLKNIY